MKQKIHMGTRLLLGLGFFIFGINGFLQFMPNPPMTPEAGALLGAFVSTGYFLPMIKIIEMTVGVMLLANFFAPLAVVLLAPILIGITSIHLFLNPAGLPVMIVLLLLEGYTACGYMKHYKGVLTRKSEAF